MTCLLTGELSHISNGMCLAINEYLQILSITNIIQFPTCTIMLLNWQMAWGLLDFNFLTDFNDS